MATPEQSTETQNQENEQSTETQNQENEQSTETQNQDEGFTFDDGDEEVQDTKPDQKVDNEKINQEKVNKRINTLVFEKKEEQRKREKLEEEHRKALARIKELEGTSDDIEIPEMPDAYDPEYARKVTERDKAIRAKAEADAKAVQARQAEEQRQQQLQQEARNKYQEQSKKMYADAAKMGIEEKDMQQAEKTLSMFIRDPALAQFILAHEDSAAIVSHLASNMDQLERIATMPGVNASVYIMSEILPEASKLKPSTSKTPDPLDIPKGKATDTVDPYLKGVKFE
jgi:hypothetical protein